MTPQIPEKVAVLSFKSLLCIVAVKDAALSTTEASWSPEEHTGRIGLKVPEISSTYRQLKHSPTPYLSFSSSLAGIFTLLRE